MNTLNQFFLLELNHILLQSTSGSFQINFIFYLLIAVVLLILVVLIYAYNILQIVLKANGSQQDIMTVDWVKILYVVTIGLGLLSSYGYLKLA